MLGNLSEDIAQDDAFLDGGDLFGLALDSPQTSIPVNLFKKTGAATRAVIDKDFRKNVPFLYLVPVGLVPVGLTPF